LKYGAGKGRRTTVGLIMWN